jgi:hypothetical protein
VPEANRRIRIEETGLNDKQHVVPIKEIDFFLKLFYGLRNVIAAVDLYNAVIPSKCFSLFFFRQDFQDTEVDTPTQFPLKGYRAPEV